MVWSKASSRNGYSPKVLGRCTNCDWDNILFNEELKKGADR